MSITDLIYQHVCKLSATDALEVLRFIEFIEFKQQQGAKPPIESQPGNINLLQWLENLPAGTRSADELYRDLQALRNEWE
ncbi:hypothetical protein THII_3805 [Thioploca ingrica]|uniref:DUF2281 domain-containing protein n=1 Tax=Thioploca ingrica TaxID=40754 RepID=A0A090APB7_9GAMM|nr:hypothetical protein THII_3805 [Thioploca ingrica]